jgi:hypothetical protein
MHNVLKDQAVLVLYTNDLASTPIELINRSKDTSVECVPGLAPLHGLETKQCIELL